jgi:hypothetical protein
MQSTQRSTQKLITEGLVQGVDAEATACLIMGCLRSASSWIAHSNDSQSASESAVKSFLMLASGLLHEREPEGFAKRDEREC